MTPFERLHPALQHHIVNTLGWSSLRPLQEATIEPLLRGEHAILLAPTAGGKTEAAAFPLFSRMLQEDWRGLSVLYICPLKALLNNLVVRLAHYGQLLGRRVGVWHGDIRPAARERIKAAPPDILLTTPESIEVMLVSRKVEHRQLFAQLRAVVIDEVHAFAGDDRGWHLLYLLERLTRVAGRELQRLGLSATVGNPQGLCDWLAGGCRGPRRVINPPADGGPPPQIQVDWVGKLDNAALVISRLHRGEKRLVFCDSRARVEQLALLLRQLGVETYLSHSCLSTEARTAAEEAFGAGEDCVIVATSTLELGIDVGDLDRVIQIDGPATVASLLQRMGRTGRRPGTARNYLFLVTREEAFLHVAALVQLWREGFVEPVAPPPLPLHIFAQQIMALALQEGGIGRGDWPAWLERLPGLEHYPRAELTALIDSMVARGVLHGDQGVLGIGARGEHAFGQKHFMALFSVFVSPPLIRVFHGRREIGEVHRSTFLVQEEGPTLLVLAGQTWQTQTIDWARRRAFVEPSKHRGRTRWLSSGQPRHFALCQAMMRVLMSGEVPVRFSQRARDFMGNLREAYDWVEPGYSFLIQDGTSISWWTFAGKYANGALAAALASPTRGVSFDDLALCFADRLDLQPLADEIRGVLADEERLWCVPLDEDFIAELKFADCLTPKVLTQELNARYDVSEVIGELRRFPIRTLKVS